MRKYMIRWWRTSEWRREQCRDLWDPRLGMGLRTGLRCYLENPFTPQEEIVFGNPPDSVPEGRALRITKIDVEKGVVTLG